MSHDDEALQYLGEWVAQLPTGEILQHSPIRDEIIAFAEAYEVRLSVWQVPETVEEFLAWTPEKDLLEPLPDVPVLTPEDIQDILHKKKPNRRQ